MIRRSRTDTGLDAVGGQLLAFSTTMPGLQQVTSVRMLLLAALAGGCHGVSLRDGVGLDATSAFDARLVAGLEREVVASPIEPLYARALLGDVVAERRLASMYVVGSGVHRNLAAAVDWFERAAEQNDCAAQYQLGLLYLGGWGMPYDIETAAKWLRRAAEHPPQDCTS